MLTCVLAQKSDKELLVFKNDSFVVLKFGTFFTTSLKGEGNDFKKIISAKLYSTEFITLLFHDSDDNVILTQFQITKLDTWRPIREFKADYKQFAVDVG